MIRLANTLRVSALALTLFLSSCNKLFDYVDQHRDQLAKCCRIIQLSVSQNYITGAPEQHYNFTYDTKGRPVKIEAQDPGHYGYIALHFAYDNHGRVRDYQFTDAGQTFIYTWHRYVYPGANIIIDSVYNYKGHVGDPYPPTDEIGGGPGRATRITLDWKGRAVKYQPLDQHGAPTSDTYTVQYDANGNKVIPGAIYDDKVNPYQLSPAYQLAFDDFSRNNTYMPPRGEFPRSIPSYNQYGLPLELLYLDYPPSTASLFGFPFSRIDVTYDCNISTKGL